MGPGLKIGPLEPRLLPEDPRPNEPPPKDPPPRPLPLLLRPAPPLLPPNEPPPPLDEPPPKEPPPRLPPPLPIKTPPFYHNYNCLKSSIAQENKSIYKHSRLSSKYETSNSFTGQAAVNKFRA